MCARQKLYVYIFYNLDRGRIKGEGFEQVEQWFPTI